MIKLNEITLIIIALFLGLWACTSHSKTIKVLLIDTGIDLTHPEISKHVKEEWNYNYIDMNKHGTAMASIVLKDTCSEVELISCRYWFPWNENLQQTSNNCFKRALTEDIQYINYSSSGEFPDNEEKEIIKQLSDKGVIIVVAAGNKAKNLTKTGECKGSYPACFLYKNVYPVENVEKNGFLHYQSNYLTHPNARAEMGVDVPCLFPYEQSGTITGTSPAAAKYTNRLLLRRCWELKK